MSLDEFHGIKLLTLCGGGAYGDVYYASDISGKKIAIKIISKKKLGHSWERELKGVINYRQATQAAPELLQIYHVAETDDNFYYTMEPADSTSKEEYIPDTLAGRLQAGPLPHKDLYEILWNIFVGIKAIHNAGFSHRDIKPDNILFVNGKPKLADIGLMTSLTNSVTQLAGTLDFIPPEERSCDNSNQDKKSAQKSDLYALGKVIYCAATGLTPNQFPAIPKNLPLSLPLKFFLHLAFQLCNKNPYHRLNSIEKVENEFKQIERKLLFGENIGDKISYFIKSLRVNFSGTIISSLKTIISKWYLMVLFFAIGGAIVYQITKPIDPYNFAQNATKTFTIKKLDISFNIPHHWEILTNDTIKKNIDTTSEMAKKLSKKQIKTITEQLQYLDAFICCNFKENYIDNITISYLNDSKKEFPNMALDDFRFNYKKIIENQYGVDVKILESKKITIQNRSCIYLDLTYIPGVHGIILFIPNKDKIIMMSLSAQYKNFEARKKELFAILDTIKFLD